MEDLVTQDMKNAEVLNVASKECQVLGTRGKGWSKEDVPLLEEDQIREYLSKPDVSLWALLGCTLKC